MARLVGARRKAAGRIRTGDRGFAIRCLTTWLRRHLRRWYSTSRLESRQWGFTLACMIVRSHVWLGRRHLGAGVESVLGSTSRLVGEPNCALRVATERAGQWSRRSRPGKSGVFVQRRTWLVGFWSVGDVAPRVSRRAALEAGLGEDLRNAQRMLYQQLALGWGLAGGFGILFAATTGCPAGGESSCSDCHDCLRNATAC